MYNLVDFFYEIKKYPAHTTLNVNELLLLCTYSCNVMSLIVFFLNPVKKQLARYLEKQTGIKTKKIITHV